MSRSSFEDTKHTQAQGVMSNDIQVEMSRSSFEDTKHAQTQGVIPDDISHIQTQGETVIPLEDNIVENQSAESFDSFDSFNSQML